MRTLAGRRLFPGRCATPQGVAARSYLMAYNGRTGVPSNQRIGIAGSPDGVTWTKLTVVAPALGPSATGWDSNFVAAPSLLKLGANDYRMWFEGYDGSHFQIGYAASGDGVAWSKLPANPVLARGGTGAWDEFGVWFPYVFYEPSDASRPFKMWYTGASVAASTTLKLGYAYSTDGINWTKSSSNPVMTVGAGGSYDAVGVIPGNVVKVGSTYNLFYQGVPTTSTPEGDQVCLATFTDPEGTYTRSGSNPILALSTASQSLTSNLTASSATVVVASTTGFHVNEPGLLFDSTLAQADVVIKSIDSSTQMTLTQTVGRAWTTANTASIRSLYTGALDGRTILSSGGSYVMFTVPFQQFGATQVSERTAAATSSSLTSGWSFDYTRGFVLALGPYWDTVSAENPSVIVE